MIYYARGVPYQCSIFFSFLGKKPVICPRPDELSYPKHSFQKNKSQKKKKSSNQTYIQNAFRKLPDCSLFIQGCLELFPTHRSPSVPQEKEGAGALTGL